MRKILLAASVALIGLSGAALAQGAGTQNSTNMQTPSGVVSSNGAGVGPAGGLKAGVGITEAAPAVGGGAAAIGSGGTPKSSMGTNSNDSGAGGNGTGTGGSAGGTK